MFDCGWLRLHRYSLKGCTVIQNSTATVYDIGGRSSDWGEYQAVVVGQVASDRIIRDFAGNDEFSSAESSFINHCIHYDCSLGGLLPFFLYRVLSCTIAGEIIWKQQ